MTATALLLALTLLSTSSLAQPRLSTPSMPCGAAAGLVSSRGTIVLGTGGHTYDRFVRDVGFCERDETTEPAWALAADTPHCFVGYRCKSLNQERGTGSKARKPLPDRHHRITAAALADSG